MMATKRNWNRVENLAKARKHSRPLWPTVALIVGVGGCAAVHAPDGQTFAGIGSMGLYMPASDHPPGQPASDWYCSPEHQARATIYKDNKFVKVPGCTVPWASNPNGPTAQRIAAEQEQRREEEAAAAAQRRQYQAEAAKAEAEKAQERHWQHENTLTDIVSICARNNYPVEAYVNSAGVVQEFYPNGWNSIERWHFAQCMDHAGFPLGAKVPD